MHVQHIYLVPLQQVVKCIAANPLDKLPLGFVDGDALQPIDRHGRELQSRNLASFQKRAAPDRRVASVSMGSSPAGCRESRYQAAPPHDHA